MAAKAAKKASTTRAKGKATARKSRARKPKRIEPAIRHLRYQLTNSGTPGTETSHFFDLFRDLSAVNRRLYQQGRDLHIKKITVTSRDTRSGLVSVGTAPSSWPVHQGWKMAKKMFDEMRMGHGGAPGSGMPTSITPATWADFKVYLSADHKAGTNAVPLDNGNNQVKLGEWVYSKYQSPDGTTGADEYTVHLLGAHVGSAGSRTEVGIVQAYEEARRTVEQDNTGSEINTDSPWVNLFDDGTTLDEIATDMLNDGDLPPYDINEYPGGATNLPKPLVAGMAALAGNWDGNPPPGAAYGAPSVTIGGFNAPCGLLEIEIQSTEANDVFDVLIEVASGDYKGVKALAM